MRLFLSDAGAQEDFPLTPQPQRGGRGHRLTPDAVMEIYICLALNVTQPLSSNGRRQMNADNK